LEEKTFGRPCLCYYNALQTARGQTMCTPLTSIKTPTNLSSQRLLTNAKDKNFPQGLQDWLMMMMMMYIVHVTAEIVGSGGESEQAVQQSEEMVGLTADSDWHALSQKEEADLDTIMSQCEFAISNAEKFADQLSRDLSVLDGVRRLQ